MDINLVQSLDFARRLSQEDGREGSGWDRLRAALASAVEGVTEGVDDVGYHKAETGDRIDRTAEPDPELVQRVRAAMIALRDDPTDERADAAAEHVEQLSRQVR